MLKRGTIHPPFSAVKKISDIFLPFFREVLSDYRISGNSFSRFEFSELLEERIKRYSEMFKIDMPLINLRNIKAQKILDEIEVSYRVRYIPDKKLRGSVIALDTDSARLEIYPIIIFKMLGKDIDFGNVYVRFKEMLETTISHELVHAIHFAYEHAPIKIDSVEEEKSDVEFKYLDESGFEEIDYSKYENKRYRNKYLPWSNKNIELDKYRDKYHSNRLELQAHPTDLAFSVFNNLIKNKESALENIRGMTDSELGMHLMWAYKYLPISSMEDIPYKQVIEYDKEREFLTHAFKRLKYIIKEYIRDNS